MPPVGDETSVVFEAANTAEAAPSVSAAVKRQVMNFFIPFMFFPPFEIVE
jgi:hypothetical protein